MESKCTRISECKMPAFLTHTARNEENPSKGFKALRLA